MIMAMDVSLLVLTKYEYTVMISRRAEDIASGEQPTVEFEINESPIDMAIREYQQHRIPTRIKRKTRTGDIVLDPNTMNYY
jgi:DNA-directed RNA polymerase subunit K/omega